MAGNISVSSRMNVWRPSGDCVYFTSLTKASANNNGESELRPPEPQAVPQEMDSTTGQSQDSKQTIALC